MLIVFCGHGRSATWIMQVQGAIKRGNARKKAIANYLQWAGQTYVRQRRIVQVLKFAYDCNAWPSVLTKDCVLHSALQRQRFAAMAG